MAHSKGVPGKAILKSLQAVLFFGTPNQGMDITSLVPMVEGQPNEPFLRSLDYDSSELRQQAKLWDQTFVLREGDILSASFLIVSFYETRESPTAIQVGIHVPDCVIFLVVLSLSERVLIYGRWMANGKWLGRRRN